MLSALETNLQSETMAAQPAGPCVMTIFGASGDLTKRKLIPALYNLAKENLLSKEFALVGFARRAMTNEEFREKIGGEISQFATTQVDLDLWRWFSHRLYYVQGDADDPAAYQKLASQLIGLRYRRSGPRRPLPNSESAVGGGFSGCSK